MLQRLTAKFIAMCIVIFIAWVSFVPEPLQVRYLGIVKIYLWVILLVSLIIHRFRIYNFSFKGSDKYVWVYLLLLLAGLVNPADKILAKNFYINLTALSIPIYFILENEINESNLRKVLLCFVIFAFMVAIIGILEILFGRNIIYERYVNNYFYARYLPQKRMMSTLIHPNILGCYLLGSGPLAYYFYISTQCLIRKKVYFFIFVIIAISAMATFSRGTWLAALISASLYLFLKKRKKALILTWVISFVFIALAPNISIGGMKYRFNLPVIAKNAIKDHRIDQYLVTINMLKEHPFMGVGLNNYRKVFDKYAVNKLYNEVKIPDSIYLMHLAETGMIGFFGFMVLLFSILKKSLLFLKKYINTYDARLFISLAFLAILFNMAFFDGFLWHTPFYLFWIFAGILASIEFKNENIP